LQIQISAHVELPRGYTITGQVLREAIAYRLDTADDPPGIRLQIVRWRHGTKAWRDGRADDWRALKGPLYGWSRTPARVDNSAFRARQANRKT
jgi:hypothetical protein